MAGAQAYRVQFSTQKAMTSFQTVDVLTPAVEWNYLDPQPTNEQGATRLRASTYYYFRVKVISRVDLAHEAATVTAYSPVLRVRTASKSSYPYLTPVSLRATTRTTSSQFVSWSSRGPGVSYRIRYATSSPLTGKGVKVVDVGESAAVLTGLQKGTRYYWSVGVVTRDTKHSTLSNVSKVSSFTTTATSVGEPFTVATYNICSHAASCFQQDGRTVTWAQRQAALSATIAAAQPDVIGFQEAYLSEDLVEAVNSRGLQLVRLGTDHWDSSLAFNSRRLVLEDSGNQTLSGDGLRNAVWAQLRDISTGRQMFVVSTHLAVGNSAQDRAARATQAAEVVSMIRAQNQSKLEVVILGDLNTSKLSSDHSTIYNTFVGAGYVDTFANPPKSRYPAASHAEHLVNTDYNSANQYIRRAVRAKFVNGFDIDYVWTSKKTRVEVAKVSVSLDRSGNFTGVIPSDHNMVTATIQFR